MWANNIIFPPGLSLRSSQNQGKSRYFPFTSCFLLCQSTFKSFLLWRDDTRRFASVTTFLWRDSHWSFELQVLCKQAQKGQHISPFVETRVWPVGLLEWLTHWPSERAVYWQPIISLAEIWDSWKSNYDNFRLIGNDTVQFGSYSIISRHFLNRSINYPFLPDIDTFSAILINFSCGSGDKISSVNMKLSTKNKK